MYGRTHTQSHGDMERAADLAALLRSHAVRTEQGTIQIGAETVRYRLREVDARAAAHRDEDGRRGWPAGNVIVVVPGHGQTVHGPRRLLAAAALLSRSKIAWCIDPVPARGGDTTEAQAIAAVVRHKLAGLCSEAGAPVLATLIGWSHGGAEALRAAANAPDLFPHYIGLCPAGFIERSPIELVASFGREALRIMGRSALKGRWAYIRVTLHLGSDLTVGLVRDLWDSRSLRAVVEDVAWAARQVPGPEFVYPGEVVAVWGSHDSVVRWRDVFPGCGHPDDLPGALPTYCPENLPAARRVEMQVLDGDHISPEGDAVAFVGAALRLAGQLDEIP